MSSTRILFRIADIVCALCPPDLSMEIRADGAIGMFVVQGSKPDIVIKTVVGNLSSLSPRGPLVFDSGSLWQCYEDDDSYLYRFQVDKFGPFPYKVAKIQRDYTSGEVLLHGPYFESRESVYPLDYPLDELLFINCLARGRGAEIHACGVSDVRGNGRLFIGNSGAGKTTIARLWANEPGVTVLSDDRIMLRKMDGQFWIYGTPWHGEAGFATPARAPLKEVYFLQKGLRNNLRSLATVESVGRLFACCFPVFHDRRALDFTVSLFEDVVRSVPCCELTFVPNPSITTFLEGFGDGVRGGTR